MARPISLAALTVLELTPPEMVDCAAAAGFSHVGIRLLPATPTEPQYDIVGDTPLLREVERRLADTGVKVLDVEIFRLKPDTRVSDYEAAIATAARLGASELLLAGNDPDEARLIDSFAAFCDLAGSYGLGADLEFMPWTDAKDLPQAARIIERTGRDNAGMLLALPRDLPLSLEVPTLTLAKTVDATERARRALAATKRVLAQLDDPSTATTRPGS